MPKDIRYWIRKHLKGTEVFIDCQACKCHGVEYHAWNNNRAYRVCAKSGKSLDYWPYANAPRWCLQRRANGGML